MRIGLVCPYSFDIPGGVGTHIHGLASWLRSQGHEVLVLGPGLGPSRPGELRMGDSKAFHFNGSTANLAVRPAQARAALAALEGADLVHVHEPLTPGLAFAAARHAKRLVVTHHANFTPGPLAGPLRIRAKFLGERRSIAVSVAAALTAKKVTGVQPVVIPNAIELPPLREPSRGRVPVVLFVGRRNDPRKGYQLFEKVADRMADEARFVAVGPGERRSRVVAEYGQVSPEVLDEWFSRASILMAPNTHGESFGMVLVEALARGCGIVASTLKPFLALAGESPMFEWFDPGDVEGAVAALRRLLASPVDTQEARHLATKYSWDVIGPRVVEQYAVCGIK